MSYVISVNFTLQTTVAKTTNTLLSNCFLLVANAKGCKSPQSIPKNVAILSEISPSKEAIKLEQRIYFECVTVLPYDAQWSFLYPADHQAFEAHFSTHTLLFFTFQFYQCSGSSILRDGYSLGTSDII